MTNYSGYQVNDYSYEVEGEPGIMMYCQEPDDGEDLDFSSGDFDGDRKRKLAWRPRLHLWAQKHLDHLRIITRLTTGCTDSVVPYLHPQFRVNSNGGKIGRFAWYNPSEYCPRGYCCWDDVPF